MLRNQYSLQYFNSYNAMFQTRSIIIQDLYSNTTKLLKLLCQNFIKPSLLRDDLSKLVYSYPNNLLPESEVFFGAECEMEIKNLPDSIVFEVRTQCLKCYIKAAEEISIRLPLNNNIFKEITFLDSSITLDASNRSSVKHFPVLTNVFENYISPTKLIEEWRELPYFFNKEEINNLKNMSIN
ncbi:protein FAM200B-like [Aphis craccivora]|uniref:Protein FAM200B-like n=1 Tax=Aphis craccivora TaxID=307492 RepID=A0A6G0WYV8_APHCR|nr:protein FAM200B-like [Aphis craccivora]